MEAKRLIQQGDVLFYQIDKLPDGLKERAAKYPGQVTFAEGELTGHHHSAVLEPVRAKRGSNIVEAPNCELLEDERGQLYCRVEAPEVKVTHQEHKTVRLSKGLYQVNIVQEYDHLKEEADKCRD